MKICVLPLLLLPAFAFAQTAADRTARTAKATPAPAPLPATLVYLGKTYHAAFPLLVKPKEVRLYSAADGNVTLPWASLPPEWKEALQAKHEAALKTEDQQSMRNEAKAAGAVQVFGTVIDKTPAGLVLVTDSGEIRLLKDYPGQEKIAKGDSVGAWGVPDGTTQCKNLRGEECTAPAFKKTVLDP